jgi:cyclopropane fatty-acyl-phospholipid synthase-like methyltransferase
MSEARRSAPAALRNRDPILAVLRRILPARGRVLEVASGTGEHAIHFAAQLPEIQWKPSDPDPDQRASIAAWIEESGCSNVEAPIYLDVSGPWPEGSWDAIVAINLVHISPWEATRALLLNAGRILPSGAPLCALGSHTADSNRAFDESLRARDPRFGVRDLEAVVSEAGAAGLAWVETVPMPANNFSLVFRRR